MEKMSWIDDNDVLVKNLDALGFVELYFNVPPAEDINYRLVSYRDDTCAMYSFFEPMTEAQHGTPRDKDYKEAVRQTLERWADRDEEEKE